MKNEEQQVNLCTHHPETNEQEKSVCVRCLSLSCMKWNPNSMPVDALNEHFFSLFDDEALESLGSENRSYQKQAKKNGILSHFEKLKPGTYAYQMVQKWPSFRNITSLNIASQDFVHAMSLLPAALKVCIVYCVH